jgi:hypothetical protein
MILSNRVVALPRLKGSDCVRLATQLHQSFVPGGIGLGSGPTCLRMLPSVIAGGAEVGVHLINSKGLVECRKSVKQQES